MNKRGPSPILTEAQLDEAFRLATSVWSDCPTLSRPRPLAEDATEVAYINLQTRQIYFNASLLDTKGLLDTLPALLAHEIGHHLDYPHTLRMSAELDLIALQLFERFPPFFLNLFYDLLINEVVGRRADFQAQLTRLYAGVVPPPVDPLFTFYLAIYEALWSREGEILKEAVPEETREKANLFCQTFYSLSSIYEQFTYFCSAFASFIIKSDKTETGAQALLGDLEAPSPEDYPESMEPSKAAQDAIERAYEAGWFPKGDYEGRAALKDDPFNRMRRILSRPGTSAGNLQEAFVDRFYRRLIESTLAEIDLPPLPKVLDPFIPANLEEWEQGDEFSKIDWIGSINQRGVLAALQPLQREWISDDEPGELPGIPRLEIYLDTSGSMPNPQQGLNAMTLAAQVLATLALRRGSQVRAIIYSAGPVHTSPWFRSEELARRFLYQYIGGGTDFPFALAETSAFEHRDVIRVVVSDGDFVWNLQALSQSAPKGRKKTVELGAFTRAVEGSRVFTLLLNQVELRHIQGAHPGPLPRKLQVVSVPGSQHFAHLAGKLADALFPREER